MLSARNSLVSTERTMQAKQLNEKAGVDKTERVEEVT
jgi:hypothetical protein